MKLTNYIRDAFIRAAMQDVPEGKNYDEIITRKVLASFVVRLPPSVQKVWKDQQTQAFIRLGTFHGFGVSVSVPSIDGRYASLSEKDLPDEERHAITALAAEWKAEKQTMDSLRDKLKGAAYACTTRKALAELLPEFERYLPAESENSGRSLPVVANLVTDFMKAGWPKDKKGAAK